MTCYMTGSIWLRKVVVFCVIGEEILVLPAIFGVFGSNLPAAGMIRGCVRGKGRNFPVISTREFLVEEFLFQVPSRGILGPITLLFEMGCQLRVRRL